MRLFLNFLILLLLIVSSCDSACSQGAPTCRLVRTGTDVVETTYGYNADGYVISMTFKDSRRDSTGIYSLSNLPRVQTEEYRFSYDADGRVIGATIIRENQPLADTTIRSILKPPATVKYVWNTKHIERSEEYDVDEKLISVRTFNYDSAGRLSSVLIGAPNPMAGILKDFQYEGSTTNPTRIRIGSRNAQGTDTWTVEFTNTFGPERAPERLLRGLPFDLFSLEPWRQNALHEVYAKSPGAQERQLFSKRVSTQVNPQGYLTEIRYQINHLASVITYHLENCP